MTQLRYFALTFTVLTGCATANPGEYTSRWAGADHVSWVKLSNGFKLRYVMEGDGPPLLLLHTLRTQLDYFEKIVPTLAKRYRVVAVDLPGHGESTILKTAYDAELYRQSVAELVETLDLRDVTLVGESIGAVTALIVAAKLPQRVARVVAINPYDYGHKFGGGVRNGNAGWIIGMFHAFPIETRGLIADVVRSGFHDGKRLEPEFLDEVYATGKRSGYRRMEYSLFANWHSWVDARATYAAVKAPVTLVYGSDDWSNADDRERTRRDLALDHFTTLPDTGHFASREHPEAVLSSILGATP